MAASNDSGLDQLLEQVKHLIEGGGTTTAPVKSPTQTGNDNPAPAGSEGFQAPLKGTWHSSGGFDLNAVRPNGRKGHGGVDMRAPAGTPIYPLAPGVVTNVGTDPLGGNVVNIQHSNGVRSYYAHLSTVKVFKGDKVTNNTQIGAVGNTGNASHTFPHLHFQVWKDGQLTDPAHFFTVPKYTNLSADEQKQGPWLSDQAKQDAQAFNMKDHVQQQRAAFSNKVDTLMKLSNQFYKLVSGQSR